MDSPLHVIFENRHLLVVDKPGGISCVPDGRNGVTMSSLIRAYAGDQTVLVHRLDHHTPGVLLAAKTHQAADILLSAFKARQVEKHYLCLVMGHPHPSHQICDAYLRKDAKRAIVFVTDQPTRGALPIRTEYHVLRNGTSMSCLDVLLHTGRTHQIRAHLAYLGHPLLGDDKYGNWNFNKRFSAKTQALIAYQLILHLPTPGILSEVNHRLFESQTTRFPGRGLEV